MAVSAEQDNQVQTLNGTAAVSVANRRMVKTGHWRRLWEGCVCGERIATFFPGTSQKTYGTGFLRPLRVYGGCVCRRKTAAVRMITHRSYFVAETLNKSPAAIAGSFASTFHFESLEIHKVFLLFKTLI